MFLYLHLPLGACVCVYLHAFLSNDVCGNVYVFYCVGVQCVSVGLPDFALELFNNLLHFNQIFFKVIWTSCRRQKIDW